MRHWFTQQMGYMPVPKKITYLLASQILPRHLLETLDFLAAVHYLGSLSRTAGNSQRGINIINGYSLFPITLGPRFLVTGACMRLEVVPMKMHNSVFKYTALSFYLYSLKLLSANPGQCYSPCTDFCVLEM